MIPGPNVMGVWWKKRKFEVCEYGFWRRLGTKEWMHPSSMPKGLRREDRAVRKR